MTWATSVPILVFLGLSVLDLGPMYATDKQTSDVRQHHRLMLPPRGGIIMADSYVTATAREAGAAAERAAELKIAIYSGLEDKCIFQPIAMESLGPLNETACHFLKDLGRRISAQSGGEREREREREPSCSNGYLLSFSDSTLSCSTTVLRRQTTWAKGHSSVYIFLFS